MKIRLLWLLLLAVPLGVKAQFVIVTNNGAITINGYLDTGNATVVVPNTTNGLPVKVIAADAFNQVESMTSLIIGTNVGTIGFNAIFECQKLTSVSLPNSVTNFAQGPFWNCQALTSFTTTFSNTYYVVTNAAIMNRVLTSLIQYPSGLSGSYNVPASVTNVNDAFIGNTLTAITADPANVYYAATNGVLFSKNHSVLVSYPGKMAVNYTIPTNTTTIASAAFEYSPSVISVTIGTNVTSIGGWAFFDCQSLQSITVNSTNAFYSSTNGVLYDKGKTTLIQYPAGLAGNYTVLSTVTNIGEGAFGNAFELQSVVIPNSVTAIEVQGFYACFKLAAVSLGSKVGTIGTEAFFLCTNLSEISIPGSVTNIGSYAFANDYALDYACFQGTPPTDGGNIFTYDYSLGQILHFSGATGWTATYDGIPTEPCSGCAGLPAPYPFLALSHSGTNVVAHWPTNYSGFTLEFTTNLTAGATIWKTNSPSPIVFNTNYVSTNGISGSRRFYRLIQ